MKKLLIVFITTILMNSFVYGQTKPFVESINFKRELIFKYQFKPGHRLYFGYGRPCMGGCPPAPIFDHDVLSGKDTKIVTIEEFEALVASIKTKKEALDYVRFLTHANGQQFKHNPCPFNVELNGELKKISSLKPLDPISIEDQGERFLIERNLLLYSEPSQLIRTQEIVTKNGIYKFGVKKVLSEDKGLQAYLIYRR